MKTLATYAALIGGALHLAGCGQDGPGDAERAEVASTPTADANAATAAEPAADPAEAESAAGETAAAAETAANQTEAEKKEDAKPAAAKPEPKQQAPAPAKAAAPAAERPKQFAMCATCHSTGEGEPHRIGPNLFGVVGSKAGSKPGYAYSDAMKESGITWTKERLVEYLLAPRDMVPGTKMMVAGPKDEAARRAIVDYLATLE